MAIRTNCPFNVRTLTENRSIDSIVPETEPIEIKSLIERKFSESKNNPLIKFEILFCSAHISPFKKDAPPLASKEDRLEMLRLGLKDLPNMDITSVELERDPPSYLIDTIKQLEESRPGQYFLIFANDQLTKLHLWKDYEDLVRLAPPLIGRREKQDIRIDSSISDEISEIIRR